MANTIIQVDRSTTIGQLKSMIFSCKINISSPFNNEELKIILKYYKDLVGSAKNSVESQIDFLYIVETLAVKRGKMTEFINELEKARNLT